MSSPAQSPSLQRAAATRRAPASASVQTRASAGTHPFGRRGYVCALVLSIDDGMNRVLKTSGRLYAAGVDAIYDSTATQQAIFESECAPLVASVRGALWPPRSAGGGGEEQSTHTRERERRARARTNEVENVRAFPRRAL